jgi:hypothetical protein
MERNQLNTSGRTPNSRSGEFHSGGASAAGTTKAEKILDIDINQKFYLEYKIIRGGSNSALGGVALVLKCDPLRKTASRPVPIVKISSVCSKTVVLSFTVPKCLN